MATRIYKVPHSGARQKDWKRRMPAIGPKSTSKAYSAQLRYPHVHSLGKHGPYNVYFKTEDKLNILLRCKQKYVVYKKSNSTVAILENVAFKQKNPPVMFDDEELRNLLLYNIEPILMYAVAKRNFSDPNGINFRQNNAVLILAHCREIFLGITEDHRVGFFPTETVTIITSPNTCFFEGMTLNVTGVVNFLGEDKKELSVYQMRIYEITKGTAGLFDWFSLNHLQVPLHAVVESGMKLESGDIYDRILPIPPKETILPPRPSPPPPLRPPPLPRRQVVSNERETILPPRPPLPSLSPPSPPRRQVVSNKRVSCGNVDGIYDADEKEEVREVAFKNAECVCISEDEESIPLPPPPSQPRLRVVSNNREPIPLPPPPSQPRLQVVSNKRVPCNNLNSMCDTDKEEETREVASKNAECVYISEAEVPCENLDGTRDTCKEEKASNMHGHRFSEDEMVEEYKEEEEQEEGGEDEDEKEDAKKQEEMKENNFVDYSSEDSSTYNEIQMKIRNIRDNRPGNEEGMSVDSQSDDSMPKEIDGTPPLPAPRRISRNSYVLSPTSDYKTQDEASKLLNTIENDGNTPFSKTINERDGLLESLSPHREVVINDELRYIVSEALEDAVLYDLCKHIEVPQIKLRNINEQMETIYEKTYGLLGIWHQKFGNDATVGALLDALVAVNPVDLNIILKDMLRHLKFGKVMHVEGGRFRDSGLYDEIPGDDNLYALPKKVKVKKVRDYLESLADFQTVACNDEIRHIVSQYIDKDVWHDLGRFLQVPKTIRQQIETNKKDIFGKTFDLLGQWHLKFGSQAILGFLLEALVSVDPEDLFLILKDLSEHLDTSDYTDVQ